MIDSKREQDLIAWRRDKVFSLWSKGHTKTYIAETLKVSRDTVNRDLEWLLSQNKESLQRHLDEGIPQHYMQCMRGLQDVLLECWNIHESFRNDENVKTSEKAAILSLIKDCLKAIAELSNNGAVVQQAIEFTKGANRKLDNIKEGKGQQQQNQEGREQRKDREEEVPDNANIIANTDEEIVEGEVEELA